MGLGVDGVRKWDMIAIYTPQGYPQIIVQKTRMKE